MTSELLLRHRYDDGLATVRAAALVTLFVGVVLILNATTPLADNHHFRFTLATAVSTLAVLPLLRPNALLRWVALALTVLALFVAELQYGLPASPLPTDRNWNGDEPVTLTKGDGLTLLAAVLPYGYVLLRLCLLLPVWVMLLHVYRMR